MQDLGLVLPPDAHEHPREQLSDEPIESVGALPGPITAGSNASRGMPEVRSDASMGDSYSRDRSAYDRSALESVSLEPHRRRPSGTEEHMREAVVNIHMPQHDQHNVVAPNHPRHHSAVDSDFRSRVPLQTVPKSTGID